MPGAPFSNKRENRRRRHVRLLRNRAGALKWPLAPATLLGRLAVDRRHQGKGYRRYLLADALYRASRSEIASFAVVVDAKDDNARRFYERESFLPFPDQPMKLFRPMTEIAQLLG